MNVVINGKIVSYKKTGSSGAKVLCLHGWGSDKHTYDDLITEMGDNFQVVTVDFPGFGESEIPGSAWGIEEYSEFVKDFLEKIDFNPSVIVGHSMGGRVGVYLAAENIIDFDKLILIGAHGFKESGSVKNKTYKMVAKTGKMATKPLPKKLQTKLRSKLYSSAGAEDYLRAGELQEIFSSIIDLDLTDAATRVNIPTLLIYGENDDQTPPEFGKRYDRLIQDSELHIISNAGHYAHIDAPEKVSELIKVFI